MEAPENRGTMTQTPANTEVATMTSPKEVNSAGNMTDPRLTGMQNVRTPATMKDVGVGTEEGVMKVNTTIHVAIHFQSLFCLLLESIPFRFVVKNLVAKG